MKKAYKSARTEASGDRLRAATADLRRQLRIFNIVLVIVAIEAIVFVLTQVYLNFL